MTNDKELITAQNLAQNLNLSVETIWRYTREKKIPYIELAGKQYRYRLVDVLQALSAPNAPQSIQEKATSYHTEADKKLTYQDYLLIPDELGYHFEIIDGMLSKEPAPNVMHQRVSRRLQRILEDYFWNVDPGGEVFNAPLDVTFLDVNVVQPDLLYVSSEDKHIIKDTHIQGAPRLVVEILSPSTSRKDRMQKMRIYQSAGIRHYWLVNPMEKTLECFAWRDGVYALLVSGMDEDMVDHPDFTGLLIDLKGLWA